MLDPVTMTPMLTGGGNITVNPLGVPSNSFYIKCVPKTKSGKKCLSTIYLRNAPMNLCKNCSTNLEFLKTTNEQSIIVVAWCLSATFNSSLERKFLESGGSSRKLRFLKKHWTSRSVQKLKISLKSGSPFKRTSGAKNYQVPLIIINFSTRYERSKRIRHNWALFRTLRQAILSQNWWHITCRERNFLLTSQNEVKNIAR